MHYAQTHSFASSHVAPIPPGTDRTIPLGSDADQGLYPLPAMGPHVMAPRPGPPPVGEGGGPEDQVDEELKNISENVEQFVSTYGHQAAPTLQGAPGTHPRLPRRYPYAAPPLGYKSPYATQDYNIYSNRCHPGCEHCRCAIYSKGRGKCIAWQCIDDGFGAPLKMEDGVAPVHPCGPECLDDCECKGYSTQGGCLEWKCAKGIEGFHGHHGHRGSNAMWWWLGGLVLVGALVMITMRKK